MEATSAALVAKFDLSAVLGEAVIALGHLAERFNQKV
jgi:hypothetical protein